MKTTLDFFNADLSQMTIWVEAEKKFTCPKKYLRHRGFFSNCMYFGKRGIFFNTPKPNE